MYQKIPVPIDGSHTSKRGLTEAIRLAKHHTQHLFLTLSVLFARDEFPGATLQRIYAYCLDGIERHVSGAYSSGHAGLALARLEGG
jgi:hypothetical protein